MVRVVDKVSGPESRFVALVTGATGAIGRAIAERIAARPEYEVVLVCRDAAKAETTVETIRRHTSNPHVRYELVDLSRRASISALAERWRGPAHTLVNNAAITPRRREETPEGIERQFATNVLGYFWMTTAFRDHLARSAPARVVNASIQVFLNYHDPDDSSRLAGAGLASGRRTVKAKILGRLDLSARKSETCQSKKSQAGGDPPGNVSEVQVMKRVFGVAGVIFLIAIFAAPSACGPTPTRWVAAWSAKES